MSATLLLIVGLIYVGLGFNYAISGNLGMCITFVAYAIANYGLWVSGEGL